MGMVQRKDGPPSITVSALSRDTSTAGRIFLFLSWKVLLWSCAWCCFCLVLIDQGPLSESCGGALVPPAIYSVT